MDQTRRHASATASSESPHETRPRTADRIVPGRRAAMEALRPAILGDDAPGVVLLTGESGSGKTRLWRALADLAPPRRRFAVVEVAPAIDPLDFLNLAADAMGIDPAERLGAIRIALARALRAESAEGRSWILVVENAHHASPAVWGEVEALCGDDRWGRGFRSVLLVGRTELARRFVSRPAETMAARVSNHLHLMPLDIDEAAQLPGAGDLDPDELERLHRDSGGNLRRLLRLIDAQRPRPRGMVAKSSAPARLADHRPRPEPAPASATSIQPQAPRIDADPVPPPLVPSRPPIREEEGLIEVGWDGGLDDEVDPIAMADIEAVEAEAEIEADEPEAIPTPGDEAIDDHYAALQAWSEWARNRDRATPEIIAESESEPEAPEPGDDDEIGGETDESDADLRGEAPHDDHAPYGQLFSKLRQRG